MRRRCVLLTLIAVLATAAPAAAAPTTLRLDGIGPLSLGMTRAAAVKTGWLSGRTSGCPLGGKPYPIDYALAGSKAPGGIEGSAEFVKGKLQTLTFGKGVRTEAGVTVGKTLLTKMASLYDPDYDVQSNFEETFGGTFVSVLASGDDPVIGGFGTRKTVQTLGIPAIPLCE